MNRLPCIVPALLVAAACGGATRSSSAAGIDPALSGDSTTASPERDAGASRVAGFDRRAAQGGNGQFITRADIERRRATATSDLVRRLQGLRIVDSLGVSLAVSTRGPKVQMIGGRPVPVQCVLSIGVNGSLQEPSFPMNSVAVADIHGIEAYVGSASLPPEFGGARRDASCGLIMIWTRAGIAPGVSAAERYPGAELGLLRPRIHQQLDPHERHGYSHADDLGN